MIIFGWHQSLIRQFQLSLRHSVRNRSPRITEKLCRYLFFRSYWYFFLGILNLSYLYVVVLYVKYVCVREKKRESWRKYNDMMYFSELLYHKFIPITHLYNFNSYKLISMQIRFIFKRVINIYVWWCSFSIIKWEYQLLKFIHENTY